MDTFTLHSFRKGFKMSFTQWLSNGGFSKFIWMITQFILIIGSGAIIGIEIINNQPINQNLWIIVYGVLIHSATVGGGITTIAGSLQAGIQTPPTNINITPVPSTTDNTGVEQPTVKVSKVTP